MDDKSTDDWGDIMDLEEPINIGQIQSPPHSNDQPDTKIEYMPTLSELNLIKLINISTSDDLEIISHLLFFFKNVKFIFSKNKLDRDQMNISTQIFKKIENIVKELSIRNKQYSEYIVKKKEKDIWRNSYKFCEYGYKCKFFYNNNSQCYGQHYEYYLMYSDIIELIQYMDESPVLNQEQIKISINTLTYILNHMYDELNNLKKYSPIHYNLYNQRKLINNYCKKKHISKVLSKN